MKRFLGEGVVFSEKEGDLRPACCNEGTGHKGFWVAYGRSIRRRGVGAFFGGRGKSDTIL